MLVYKNNVMSLQELSYNFTRQKPYFFEIKVVNLQEENCKFMRKKVHGNIMKEHYREKKSPVYEGKVKM